MKFIDKLIQETKNGNLDFAWQYTSGNRFKYVIPKDVMSNLNFSLDDAVMKEVTSESGKKKIVQDETKGSIIFPNGAEMVVDKSKLIELSQECGKAIIRYMESIAKDYINSNTLQQTENTGNLENEEDVAEKK